MERLAKRREPGCEKTWARGVPGPMGVKRQRHIAPSVSRVANHIRAEGTAVVGCPLSGGHQVESERAEVDDTQGRRPAWGGKHKQIQPEASRRSSQRGMSADGAMGAL